MQLSYAVIATETSISRLGCTATAGDANTNQRLDQLLAHTPLSYKTEGCHRDIDTSISSFYNDEKKHLFYITNII